jgi:hypothetical protein
MNKIRDKISKKRQRISCRITILQDKLKSLQIPQSHPIFKKDEESPGTRQRQEDFLRGEIKRLKAEINQLVIGTRSQKKSGWARGVDAPKYYK